MWTLIIGILLLVMGGLWYWNFRNTNAQVVPPPSTPWYIWGLVVLAIILIVAGLWLLHQSHKVLVVSNGTNF